MRNIIELGKEYRVAIGKDLHMNYKVIALHGSWAWCLRSHALDEEPSTRHIDELKEIT